MYLENFKETIPGSKKKVKNSFSLKMLHEWMKKKLYIFLIKYKFQ